MAAPDKREAQPHLRDLFRIGQMFTIHLPSGDGSQAIELWLRNPGPEHQQQAIRKAGAASARLRQRLKDPDSDDYLSVRSNVDELETREQIESFLISVDENEIREQAYNDVLYGDVGSNWSEAEKNGQEGLDYLNVLEAFFDRRKELEATNEGLPPDERIGPEEDEELRRLQVTYDQFQAEVSDRAGELRKAKGLQFQNQSDEDLREKVMRVTKDLLIRTEWLEQYTAWMQYFSIRYPDDRKRLYFKDPGEIAELPLSVQAQLSDFYREVSQAGNDLKDMSTPENSSDSSEQSAEPGEASVISFPTG